jgi:hypothetical protein
MLAAGGCADPGVIDGRGVDAAGVTVVTGVGGAVARIVPVVAVAAIETEAALLPQPLPAIAMARIARIDRTLDQTDIRRLLPRQ